MESVPIPETNEYNGSGGGSNGINFTLPFAQHNPSASFLYCISKPYNMSKPIS